MTRARALKTLIRARAARTGERYTTARRHVLKEIQPQPPAAVRTTTKNAPPLSDARFREKTGHGLDHWFAAIDRFGGVDKGHTAIARHLYETHSVDGWYAQGITVAYERARGVRAVNQRCDGEFEVSVSKVMTGTVAVIVKALTDTRVRARWAKGIDAQLLKALSAAVDSPSSKGIVVRADGLGRFRYKWGGTTVQLYMLPKPGDKVSVVVTNGKLADRAMVEERRGLWRAALNALSVMLRDME